jgi:predicted dehydrogenase
LQKAHGSGLVAVMRRTAALAEDYARRHGVARWYDRAEDLIHDPEVDAVYIATPPDSHLAYALECARAGKPVYVEKPMALNYEQCQAMLQACQAAGVPLFVAYYRRALARFVTIKDLVDAGAIGAVRFVTVTLSQPLTLDELTGQALPWRVIPEVAGGGRFVDLASHMLDLLDYLLGPIRQVRGFASNQAGRYPAEDIVTGTFVFESGVQGAGTWCFTTFDRQDWTEIVGSEGRLAYATFDNRPLLLTTAAGRSEFAFEEPAHIQQPLIQTVVDALNGAGRCPSTGESAARTSWVMDQLLQEYLVGSGRA